MREDFSWVLSFIFEFWSESLWLNTVERRDGVRYNALSLGSAHDVDIFNIEKVKFAIVVTNFETTLCGTHSVTDGVEARTRINYMKGAAIGISRGKVRRDESGELKL